MSLAVRDENFKTSILGKGDVTSSPVALEADEALRVLLVALKEASPDSTNNNNPSFSFSYTDGELSAIDQEIGSNTYRKTLGYTDGELVTISQWILQ